jgi:hypothetical protein
VEARTRPTAFLDSRRKSKEVKCTSVKGIPPWALPRSPVRGIGAREGSSRRGGGKRHTRSASGSCHQSSSAATHWSDRSSTASRFGFSACDQAASDYKKRLRASAKPRSPRAGQIGFASVEARSRDGPVILLAILHSSNSEPSMSLEGLGRSLIPALSSSLASLPGPWFSPR